MNTFIIVYENTIDFENRSFQTRSTAYRNTMKSGDKLLLAHDGKIVGEAFVDGPLNTYDVTVISLGGLHRLATPYDVPMRLCFPINRFK